MIAEEIDRIMEMEDWHTQKDLEYDRHNNGFSLDTFPFKVADGREFFFIICNNVDLIQPRQPVDKFPLDATYMLMESGEGQTHTAKDFFQMIIQPLADVAPPHGRRPWAVPGDITGNEMTVSNIPDPTVNQNMTIDGHGAVVTYETHNVDIVYSDGRVRYPQIKVIRYNQLLNDLEPIPNEMKDYVEKFRENDDFMARYALRVNYGQLSGNYFDGEFPYNHLGSSREPGTARRLEDQDRVLGRKKRGDKWKREIIQNIYKKYHGIEGRDLNIRELADLEPEYKRTMTAVTNSIANRVENPNAPAFSEIFDPEGDFGQYGGKKKRRSLKKKKKQRKTKRKSRR